MGFVRERGVLLEDLASREVIGSSFACLPLRRRRECGLRIESELWARVVSCDYRRGRRETSDALREGV